MSRSPRRTAARLLPLALVLPLAPAPAFAEAIPGIDIYGKVGHWGATPSGTVASDGEEVDVEDDLNFDREGSNLLELGFEHPVPVLPNVRFRHVSLSDEADGEVTREVRFAGTTFQGSEDVHSSYDLEMTDATFYYSPLDNWVSLDVGLTARHLDAEAEIDGEISGESSASASMVIPMGHLAVRMDAPVTGIYASAEVNAISADDEHLRDTRAVVGWQPADLLAFEVGYQELSIEFDDDDLSADLDFEGPFASVGLRF